MSKVNAGVKSPKQERLEAKIKAQVEALKALTAQVKAVDSAEENRRRKRVVSLANRCGLLDALTDDQIAGVFDAAVEMATSASNGDAKSAERLKDLGQRGADFLARTRRTSAGNDSGKSQARPRKSPVKDESRGGEVAEELSVKGSEQIADAADDNSGGYRDELDNSDNDLP